MNSTGIEARCLQRTSGEFDEAEHHALARALRRGRLGVVDVEWDRALRWAEETRRRSHLLELLLSVEAVVAEFTRSREPLVARAAVSR